MTVQALIEFVTNNSIEQAYQFLDYNYEAEILYSEAINNSVPVETAIFHERVDQHERRRSFINRFDWINRNPPAREHILRLFNQINTFYAERWAFGHLTIESQIFLKEAGRLILYRQGKRSGFRLNDIAFGIRKDLDFMDPFRHFKILRGIAPGLIDRVSNVWAVVVDSNAGGSDCALLLAMALLAIHPFPDGNGRLARIAYAWLMRRWQLGERWLAEDNTGEFLRTGVSIESTEHHMSTLMLELCGGHNRIDYGYRSVRSPREDELAADVLESALRSLLHNDPVIYRSNAFTSLRDHLLKQGHFTERSPRFESLRQVMR